MIRALLFAVTVALVSQASIAGAQGQTLDRPDLEDIAQSFEGPGYRYSSGGVTAIDFPNDVRMHAEGFVVRYPKGGSRSGEVFWTLYEPDKVNRKGDTALMRQSDWVHLTVYASTENTPLFTARGIVKGCSAAANAHFDRHASWKVHCKSDALAALGLTAAQQQAFVKVFGSPIIRLRGFGGS